jgi:putative membrane protein
MRWLAEIIVHTVLNGLSLWVAFNLIPGFAFTGTYLDLALIAFVFMVLNAVVKPVLELLAAPFIILTLGLALLAINALMLYILDSLFSTLTIQGTMPLVYATLLVGAINFVFHLGTKKS